MTTTAGPGGTCGSPAAPVAGPVGADTFRALLRRQAAAVTVVTAPGPPPVGFTATSFTSVSLDPPLVSFCVAHASSVWPVLGRAEHVAIHLLARDQHEVARAFAARGIDRFGGPVRWRPGPFSVPLLDGVLAWLVCRVAGRVAAGDHEIVLAEPVEGHWTDDEPLLYHMGRYTGLEPTRPGVAHRGGGSPRPGPC